MATLYSSHHCIYSPNLTPLHTRPSPLFPGTFPLDPQILCDGEEQGINPARRRRLCVFLWWCRDSWCGSTPWERRGGSLSITQRVPLNQRFPPPLLKHDLIHSWMKDAVKCFIPKTPFFFFFLPRRIGRAVAKRGGPLMSTVLRNKTKYA